MTKPVYLHQGANAADLSVGTLYGSVVYGAAATLKEIGVNEVKPKPDGISLFKLGARRITIHLVPTDTEVVDGVNPDEPESEVIFPIISIYVDKYVNAAEFAQRLSQDHPNLSVRLAGVVLDTMSASEKMRVARYSNGKQI